MSVRIQAVLFSRNATLGIANDILASNDGGKVTFLLPLDLSVAVETIDHEIPLPRLKTDLSTPATALS